MKKIIFVFSAVLIFIACSHKVTSTSSTTTTAPAASKPKVDANAMYAADIKPIIEAKCAPCHFPDKGGGKAALDNYSAASDHIDDMIRRVQLDPSAGGYMPFKGKKDPLTATEIASLKAWKDALGK